MTRTLCVLAFALACGSLVAAQGRPATKPKAVTAASPNTDKEAAYQQLLALDDAAQEEVDRWIREEEAQRAKGGGLADITLRARVRDRLEPVRQAYEDFLRRNPRHARAHLAYGSFLLDLNEEEAAVSHMERARELDPANPAAWNNLANHYGHRGPVKKAFEYYAEAIKLDPQEPVYRHNLATTVFLFRRDAMDFYKITEPQVFDRALDLYQQALRLDPTNFVLATDYAMTYYGIKPPASDPPATRAATERKLAGDAIKAWEYAYRIAGDDIQREGVHIHLARIKLGAGQLAEARQHLAAVTNEVYNVLRNRVLRNLERQEQSLSSSSATNQSPSARSVP